MRLLGAVTEFVRPRVVIEVGVARGYSSAAILHALDSTGPDGRLHSIDLPPLAEDARTFVGAAVPPELRDRWRLELGPSRALLPRLSRALGTIDLFVHDGDHSYESQYEDLETVWPYLAPGGLAVVDDVWSTAVLDFADAYGEPVVVVRNDEQAEGIGLLRKRPRP